MVHPVSFTHQRTAVRVLWLSLCACIGVPYAFLAAQEASQRADSYRAKAEDLYYRGQYKQALTHYQQAYQLVRGADAARAASLCVDISTVYYSFGQYQRAVATCYRGVAHLDQAGGGPDSVSFKLASSLGEMYRKLGNRDSCTWFFERGNRLLEARPGLQRQIPAYVLYHFNNQGLMYLRTGNYSRGIGFLTKALGVAVAEKYPNEASVVRNNLALVYEQRGQYPEALQLRNQALRDYAADDLQKCLILSGIGWNLMQTRAYGPALGYLNRSLRLYHALQQRNGRQGNPAFAADLRNNFGHCYARLGDVGKATRAYAEAIAVFSAAYGPFGKTLAESHLGLASLQRTRGDYGGAVRAAGRAIAAAGGPAPAGTLPKRPVYEKTLLEALQLRAGVLHEQYRLQGDTQRLAEALRTYQAALEAATQLRRSYNSAEAGLHFQAGSYPLYENALEAAYQLYLLTGQARYRETAFHVLERSRAAVLSDAMWELDIRPRRVPEGLLDQERQLQQDITSIKYGLPAAPGSDRHDRLLTSEIKLARLLERFEQEYPAYYRAKYRQPAFSVPALRQSLDDRTAYLVYHWKSPYLYAGVVTRRESRLRRLRIDSTAWAQHTGQVRAALHTNPGLGAYKAGLSAIQLYQWLIEPVAALVARKERLIVSRGPDLSWLPFEVLETGKTVDDFLGKRFALSYVYAAPLPPAAGETYPARVRTLSFAPYVTGRPDGAAGADAGQPALAPLPASYEEATGVGVTVFTGRQATKGRFLEQFAQHPVVHLATHAQTDDAEPSNSFIAFYPDSDYARLYLEEIYGLDCRNTRLVVLSACKTGSGKVHRGEGLMSLARAFAFAGCPSVVTSLWDSHDGSSAYLAQRFHRHVRAGKPLDVALREARADFLNSGPGRQFNHPYYWANFVLLGATTPVYRAPAGPPWPVIGAALVPLVLLSGLAYARRRGRLAAARNPA